MFFALFSYVLLFNPNSFADWKNQFSEMQAIALDVRDARFGYGDITASTMTADFILKNIGSSKPHFYFIVDKTSAKKLSDVLNGNPTLREQTRVASFNPSEIENLSSLNFEVEHIPTNIRFDLYMHLARRVANYISSTDFHLEGSVESSNNKLLMSEKAIRVVLPVFSSGEAMLKATQNGSGYVSLNNVFGFIQVGSGQQLRLVHPGLADGELGVYPDPSAIELSQMSKEDRFSKFMSNLAAREKLSLSQAENFINIVDPVTPKFIKGAPRSLMSGITLDSSEANYDLYFSRFVDLLNAAVPSENSQAQVFFTTEKFPNLPATLAVSSRIVKLTLDSQFPLTAQPGKIYVIELPRLSQDTFVQLLSLTTGESIVSGDGTLSAGAILGLDMTMIPVNWNEGVVRGLNDYVRNRAAGTKARHFGDLLFPIVATAAELAEAGNRTPLQQRLQLGRLYSRAVLVDAFDRVGGMAAQCFNLFSGGKTR